MVKQDEAKQMSDEENVLRGGSSKAQTILLENVFFS